MSLHFFLTLGRFPKFSKASAFDFSSPPYEPCKLGLVCVLRGVPPPELWDCETSKVSPISYTPCSYRSMCEGTVPPEFSLSLNPPKGFSISVLFAGSLHTTVLSILRSYLLEPLRDSSLTFSFKWRLVPSGNLYSSTPC
jgi:hypothetical protein